MASTNDTEPNVAQITLPPGYTLEQYQAYQTVQVNLAIAMSVTLAILLWDFLSMLPYERQLFREKEQDRRLWKTPSAWAFMILRYAGILALFPGLFYTALQTQHCQLTASLSQSGVVLVTGSAGIIFIYRVFAIWSFNKVVVTLLSILYVFMVGCWIAVYSQLRATEGPPTHFGSNCQLQPVPSWDALPFAASVLFDGIVLLLTVIKLREDQMRGHDIGKRIMWDNILYFVIVSATNVAALVINCLGPSHNNIKPIVLPFPTLMTAAMGTRVYLNLRLYNARRQALEESQSSAMSTFNSMQFSSHIGSAKRNSVNVNATIVHKTSETHVQVDEDWQASGPSTTDAQDFTARN